MIFSIILLISSGRAIASGTDPIKPLKDLRNDALEIVKDFELEDLGLKVGAPEYPKVKSLLITSIKEEMTNLEVFLDKVNDSLSKDYSLVMGLKREKQTKPVKNAIKIGVDRLSDRAYTFYSGYQMHLWKLISLSAHYEKLLEECRSVLCAEKLIQDLGYWFKKAKRINKKLDLDVTKIPAKENLKKILKGRMETMEERKVIVTKYLPVAITQEEYDQVLEDERLEREEQERIALERDRQLQAAAASNTPEYQCEKLVSLQDDESYECINPYKTVNGQQIRISSEDKASNICSSQGLKLAKLAWNSKVVSKDSYTITSIQCDALTFKPAQRIRFEEKIRLSDGEIIFKDIRILSQDGFLSIQNTSENGRFLCEELGLKLKNIPRSEWSYNGHFSFPSSKKYHSTKTISDLACQE